MSAELAAAMSHPTRLGAFTRLLKGPGTVGEIADLLDVTPSALRYHLNTLEELGCIHRVENDAGSARGPTEYTYRAVDRAYFDAEGWGRLAQREKAKVSITLMRVISEELNSSMSAGAFFDPDDNHISRSTMQLDLEGWREVTEFLDGMLDGLTEIQDRVDDRRGAESSKTFPVKVAMMQFRSPGAWPPRS